jgi:hypothetical protein
MIDELIDLVDNFPGPANQTRCFTHILNLVVKSILRQFDIMNPKPESRHSLDDGSKELLSLADNLEVEEEVFSGEGEGGITAEEPEDDNLDGWIDERTSMDDDDLQELEGSVKPVRVLLTKVRLLFNTLLLNYQIMNNFHLASKDRICNQALKHYHSTTVVYDSRGLRPQPTNDAP